MSQRITKAVFPVAGLGTRFLPATKANPKEMLPIVDKPLIQYAVEEAIEAGIKELIFVTNSTKRAIEDHFDTNYELEARLAQAGKQEMLALVREVLPKGVSCAYIRQSEPLGLGHAVWCAQPIINNEPFAVLLADDLIKSHPGCLKQMVQVYQETLASIIAVEEIPLSETHRYGIVKVDTARQILQIVEKPAPKDAPSTLGVVGRYILTPSIFQCLATIKPGSGGEIQLTDAIAKLLTNEKVSALPFSGIRYDCGSKLGYLQATIAYALQHNELAEQFKAYLRQIL